MIEHSMQVLEIAIGDMKLSVIDANEPSEEGMDAFLPHFHLLYEFQYITAGVLELKDDLGTCRAEAGSYLLIPARHYHRTEYRSSHFERRAYLLAVERREESVKGFSEYRYYIALLERMDRILAAEDPQVAELITKINRLQEIQKHFQPECTLHKQKLYFSLLFVSLMEKLEQQLPKEAKQEEKTQKRETSFAPILRTAIADFIAQHYAEDNLLEALSGQLYMSRRHTTRIVSELFGMSLGALILRQRMNCAHGLIRETEESLQRIAERTGYHSYSAFYRAFRQFFGYAPETLRRQ